jgi:uncharacterized protein (TIGR04141 family)
MYLLRTSVKQYKDALRHQQDYQEFALRSGLGFSGRLFLRKPETRHTPWIKFLQEGITTKLPDLTSTPHAAVLCLKIDGRICALVFGMGRYMLKDTEYEADFGIVSALNTVDPQGLLSADTFQFKGVAVHKRTQASRTSPLAALEIDSMQEHFRAITGKAKTNSLAERVTGTEGGFGCNVRVSFKELLNHCREVLKAYKSKVHKTAFPQFEKFRQVIDKAKVADLEKKLLHKLNAHRTTGIHLAPPEPIEYDDFVGFSFTPRGESVDELAISDYLTYVGPSPSLTIDDLKRHRIHLRKETKKEPLDKWSVFKSLIVEITEGQCVYVLMSGAWYCVAKSFVGQVRTYVAGIPEVDLGLPGANGAKTEPAYLAVVEKAGNGLIVLDRKLARCEDSGDPIEICDVLTASREFIHIKRKCGGSASLSHLFLQGNNSALALLRDANFRLQARRHLQPHGASAVRRIPKDKPKKLSLVYGIMGQFHSSVADSLPFLSQISLMCVSRDLVERGVTVALTPITI